MMRSFKIKIFSNLILLASILSCSSQNQSLLYNGKSLVIKPVSEHVYVHESNLETTNFGNVSCNGAVIIDNGEAIILDTPSNETATKELIDFLNKQNIIIIAVVPTHFHADCLGYLQNFKDINVNTVASKQTNSIAKFKGYTVAADEFLNDTILKAGNVNVQISYFGAGHTTDNVVGYIQSDEVIFGGCLIKSLNANKGNLEDANLNTWSKTVENVKNKFPKAKHVIPGHGQTGTTALLDYTISLFKS